MASSRLSMSDTPTKTPDGIAASGPASVNVQVVVRCRPLNRHETANGETSIVDCNDAHREVTVRGTPAPGSGVGGKGAAAGGAGGNNAKRAYTFDRVFGPRATQEMVYRKVVEPIVCEVLEGYNCTVFAYGQTGTGKTHTMEGQRDEAGTTMEEKRKNVENAGIIPRAIRQIFNYLRSISDEYSVRVSHLELYNECLSDLLDASDGDSLRIYDDPAKGTFVSGLEEVLVKSEEDIFAVLDKSATKRRTAETLMNKFSSRSHSVFSITIHIKQSTPEGEDLLKIGKLNLVDLAGSENIGRSGAVNQRAREAGNINQSLLTLGRVITALVEKRHYIPYRDSKLTRILQESLGGRNKTCIVATVGPSHHSFDETVSTLDYALRAKSIKNRPTVNQMMTKRALIREYTEEISRLKEELNATRSKNGVFLPPEHYEELVKLRDAQGAQISQMTEEFVKTKEELVTVNAELESTAMKLEDCQLVLAGTQKELLVTKAELRDKKEELKSVKDRLDESEFMVTQYQESERALFAQSALLRGSLESSQGETRMLRKKIDRLLQQENDNMREIEMYKQETSQKTQSMASEIEAFKADHEARLTKAKIAFDEFGARQASENSSVREILSDLQSTINGGISTLRSQQTEFLSEYNEKKDESCKNFEELLGSSLTRLTELEQATRGSVSEICSVLDGSGTVAGENCARSIESLTGLMDVTQGFYDAHNAKIAEFAEAVGSRLESQSDTVVGVRNAHLKMVADQKEETRKIQDSVLQQLSGVLRQFVSTMDASLDKNAVAFGDTLQSCNSDLKELTAETATQGSELTTSLESFQTCFTGNAETFESELKSDADKMRLALNSTKNDIISAQSQILAGNTEMTTVVTHMTSQARERFEDFTASAARHNSTTSTSLTGFRAACFQSLSTSTSALATSSESASAATAAFSASAADSGAHRAAFCDTAADRAAALAEDAAALAEERTMRTARAGSTPEPHRQMLPTPVGRVGPREEVVARFWQARRLGEEARGGGRVVEALAESSVPDANESVVASRPVSNDGSVVVASRPASSKPISGNSRSHSRGHSRAMSRSGSVRSLATVLEKENVDEENTEPSDMEVVEKLQELAVEPLMPAKEKKVRETSMTKAGMKAALRKPRAVRKTAPAV